MQKIFIFYLIKKNSYTYTFTFLFVTFRHQDASVTVTFSSIENTMFKWRQKILPPSVASLSSYVIVINSNNWKHLMNYKGGIMHISLVVADDLSHNVLFINPNFVRKVAINGCFYLDATFKVVPKLIGASQFLTISSRRYNNVSNQININFFRVSSNLENSGIFH